MQLERRITRLVFDGADAIGIGSEGDFGVDDEIAAAGKKDDDVGPYEFGAISVFTFNAGEGLLKGILLSFAETGFVEQVAKDEFAPVALRFRRAAQGGREVARVFGKLLVEIAEAAHKTLQRGNASF